MLSYRTAGESHGKYLLALIEGLPFGLPIDLTVINQELKRRRCCAGRSRRARNEPDKIEIISGWKSGRTISGPLAILIPNKKATLEEMPALTRLRPGHIDIPASFKFGLTDVRPITERASARETVARVVAGAVAKMLLGRFNIRVAGYVNEIGGIILSPPSPDFTTAAPLIKARTKHLYGLDQTAERVALSKIREAEKNGDTLGGVFTVVGFNVPVGLGNHTQWDLRLDSRLAAAVMAIPAVKGVEIGLGFGYRHLSGSTALDRINFSGHKLRLNAGGGLGRLVNNAGGIEGGLTNGENIIVHAAVKPVPTLKSPLPTVDSARRNKLSRAQVESADICAVAPGCVIGEAVVAFELARAFLDKFGGDTMAEVIQRFHARGGIAPSPD